jgi:hypothetical protein
MFPLLELIAAWVFNAAAILISKSIVVGRTSSVSSPHPGEKQTAHCQHRYFDFQMRDYLSSTSAHHLPFVVGPADRSPDSPVRDAVHWRPEYFVRRQWY